jgi:hypothetical protein
VADRIGNPFDLGDGRMFWPLDARPNEVRIEDIAHSLANICRWGGRCSHFYSVAQHSLLVSEIVEETHPDIALQALLHDAAEAYLGDIITPLKGGLLFEVYAGDVVERMAFHSVEKRLHTTILIGLGVPLPSTDDDIVIAAADEVALATEARDLMGDPEWARTAPAREARIFPLPPEAAKRAFLAAVQRLTAMGVGCV